VIYDHEVWEEREDVLNLEQAPSLLQQRHGWLDGSRGVLLCPAASRRLHTALQAW
jgi:hypothetical protein